MTRLNNRPAPWGFSHFIYFLSPRVVAFATCRRLRCTP